MMNGRLLSAETPESKMSWVLHCGQAGEGGGGGGNKYIQRHTKKPLIRYILDPKKPWCGKADM